jgi:hypothetical protein
VCVCTENKKVRETFASARATRGGREKSNVFGCSAKKKTQII